MQTSYSAGNASFSRNLLRLAVPIVLQNLVTTAVSSADVIMLGFVSQDALAAGSLASQIMFILNLVYSGISSGVIMLAAQYWGKQDTLTIERVIFATAANASALLLNILLNAVFIFGLLGAPKMGIAGVALATTIARGIEFAICMLDALKFKTIRFRPSTIFERHNLLFVDFMKYSLPAFGNEVSWGLAFSMYSVIMGHLGSDIVAANAVVVVARNLGTVA